MDNIIKEIIEDIKVKSQDKGTYCDFGSDFYKPHSLDKRNFYEIFDAGETGRRIAFIDGGNNEIIASSDFSLHLIRIFEVVYENNLREKSHKYEFYCLASASRQGDSIFYNVKTYPINYDFKVGSFDSFDKTLMTGLHRVSVSRICEAVRKLAEIDIASRLADNFSSGDIIVRDGDLMANATYEIDFFNKLYAKAEEKEIIICGLSKTTLMFTETGWSLVSALKSMAPDGAWYYYPLAENENPLHPADIYTIKLDRKSKYCFKLEVYNKIEYDIRDVAGLLKLNSSDPVFLGYPYGLIVADRFARVSNSEVEYIGMKLKTTAGKDWKEIEESLHSIDAHGILDNII
ncbi:MAG: hypothetical protein U9R34_01440 [Nanoarchaeota archaeon]|nr:hypothetical protein [Nanoarchaeota archaeon]